MSKKKFWNSEKIVSFSAILISCITLFVFIYQTDLIKEQQTMSVYPHLSMGNSYSGSIDYAYTITNDGVGPAMIKSLKIKYKDSVLNQDLATYIFNKLEKVDSVNFSYANLYVGQLIPAEKTIQLIKNTGSLRSANMLRDVVVDDNLSFEIIYESIYKDRWKITSGSNIPEEIE